MEKAQVEIKFDDNPEVAALTDLSSGSITGGGILRHQQMQGSEQHYSYGNNANPGHGTARQQTADFLVFFSRRPAKR